MSTDTDTIPDDVRDLLATVVEALTHPPEGYDEGQFRDRAAGVRGTLQALLDYDVEVGRAVTVLRRQLDETATPGDRDEAGGNIVYEKSGPATLDVSGEGVPTITGWDEAGGNQ
jgi:hypothetical protein